MLFYNYQHSNNSQDKWNSLSTLLHSVETSAGAQDPILGQAHPGRYQPIKESPEQWEWSIV